MLIISECAKRWQHSLDPNIVRSKWELKDDEVLLRAVVVYGRCWTKISEEIFSKRSPMDVKNRSVIQFLHVFQLMCY